MAENKDAVAEDVISKYLKVEKFIDDNRDDIYNKFEENDRLAEKQTARVNSDMLFVAESLPIVNGIIHLGSSRKELQDASQKVRTVSDWGDLDPSIVLAALTFIYIANKAQEEFATDKTRKAIWDRIKKRVAKLI